MLNKQGKGNIENPLVFLGGLVIIAFFIFTIFSSGLARQIVGSFNSAFGPLGALLGVLFIIMIILAMVENLRRR